MQCDWFTITGLGNPGFNNGNKLKKKFLSKVFGLWVPFLFFRALCLEKLNVYGHLHFTLILIFFFILVVFVKKWNVVQKMCSSKLPTTSNVTGMPGRKVEQAFDWISFSHSKSPPAEWVPIIHTSPFSASRHPCIFLPFPCCSQSETRLYTELCMKSPSAGSRAQTSNGSPKD